MLNNNKILQELYRHSPWRMLICCIMLNQSSGKQVKPIALKLFDRFPTPLSFIGADQNDIADILRPIGFQNVKAKRIQQFVNDFFNTKWERPIELRGIGQYAQDSWDIFIKKKKDVKPTDKVLIAYLERRKSIALKKRNLRLAWFI